MMSCTRECLQQFATHYRARRFPCFAHCSAKRSKHVGKAAETGRTRDALQNKLFWIFLLQSTSVRSLQKCAGFPVGISLAAGALTTSIGSKPKCLPQGSACSSQGPKPSRVRLLLPDGACSTVTAHADAIAAKEGLTACMYGSSSSMSMLPLLGLNKDSQALDCDVQLAMQARN